MFVARFQKRTNSRYSSEWTNLYVRNIPSDWTEAKLEELFSQYGAVNSTYNICLLLVFLCFLLGLPMDVLSFHKMMLFFFIIMC